MPLSTRFDADALVIRRVAWPDVRNKRLYDTFDWLALRTPIPESPHFLRKITAQPATCTTKHYEPWATASSASCTAASRTRTLYRKNIAWAYRVRLENAAA